VLEAVSRGTRVSWRWRHAAAQPARRAAIKSGPCGNCSGASVGELASVMPVVALAAGPRSSASSQCRCRVAVVSRGVGCVMSAHRGLIDTPLKRWHQHQSSWLYVIDSMRVCTGTAGSLRGERRLSLLHRLHQRNWQQVGRRQNSLQCARAHHRCQPAPASLSSSRRSICSYVALA